MSASAIPPRAFTDLLRERTTSLHRQAERSGIVRQILAGESTRAGYAVFVRNLLPAYRELESALERHQEQGFFRSLFRSEVLRAPALQNDLVHLAGGEWAERLPLLPEGARYAARIASAAEAEPSLLVAHAYTRYLGDLGGGPILRRRLATMVEAACLSFYEFPGVTDLPALAREYRAALDAALATLDDLDRVVEEARVAFQLNIDLSEAVQTLVPSPR
jgi:heme oxygenase